MAPLIDVRHVRKSYGGRVALEDVSFSIERGKTLVILGASGGGKSTLLKVLISAAKPDSGEVLFDGTDITKLSEPELAPVRRKFGVLFQEGALLNSLTVGENVELPIRHHTSLPPETIEIMVKMKLELVGLRDADGKLPSELSGGMRKRVGVARALVLEPEIVLYDEPTTGLDPLATDNVDRMILDVAEKFHVTSVVVTHDMASVFRIADQISMVQGGQIVYTGTPEEVRRTENADLRRFIETSGVALQ